MNGRLELRIVEHKPNPRRQYILVLEQTILASPRPRKQHLTCDVHIPHSRGDVVEIGHRVENWDGLCTYMFPRN